MPTVAGARTSAREEATAWVGHSCPYMLPPEEAWRAAQLYVPCALPGADALTGEERENISKSHRVAAWAYRTTGSCPYVAVWNECSDVGQ